MPQTTVIAVTFPEESAAYQALSVLRQAAAADRVRVLSAAVVERDTFGGLRVREAADQPSGEGLAGGSLIGMLIGVLGGPVGMLLGFGAGALIGGALDVERVTESDAAMSGLARAIPPGRTALVAELEEVASEVVDGAMADLGGIVLRRPAADVLAELEAAEEVALAAEEEARRRMRDERKAERKEEYEERKARLREKLHRS